MNSRSPRRKYVSILLCAVTLLELVDKTTFGFNTESPQEQDSKRFSLFYKVKEDNNETTTTRGTQEVSPSQYQAPTPASRVPSTQRATTAAPGSGRQIKGLTFKLHPVSNCGQQWHAYKSGCLRLFEDHKKWEDANQHCANISATGGGNGRLISIFSEAENNRIVDLRSSQGFSEGEYYIGLSDLQGTGTYKWVDGTNASFTNWNPGFPNGEKGVVMKMSIGNLDNGKWLTRNYNDALRFICECPDGRCA
ncbi:lithostathine-like [Acropora muricata]|uniref:lithostathine-like n=1 Tax=Acropora muricata TaxID=159855 RepID=UPI0034E50F35